MVDDFPEINGLFISRLKPHASSLTPQASHLKPAPITACPPLPTRALAGGEGAGGVRGMTARKALWAVEIRQLVLARRAALLCRCA
jgi:hypothetical protein